jgi:hypothetical protein
LASYEKPSAFLLTSKAENKKWPLSDYQNTLDSAKSGKHYQTEWSTGHSKKPFCGARVFLLKQGKPPMGLMGIGRIVRIPPHQQRRTRTSVFIVVEQMLDYEREPLFDREQLLKIGSNTHPI